MIHGIRRTKIMTAGRRDGETWLFPDNMLLILYEDSFSVRRFSVGPLDPMFSYGRKRADGWTLEIYGKLESVHWRRREALRHAVTNYRAAQFAGTL